MSNLKFSELELAPKVLRAIDEMGFDTTTEIQSKAIPLIRTGVDVIGRSQTGTGKTIAFAIPAIEIINTEESKPTVQVLILCPTRELAQQACEEVKKLTQYCTGINTAEVYGGASMERQILKLKRANIVIGTPGRVMDHLRRKTMKLNALKMVVLDEADEMLSMGFKEDIETILTNTPEEKQIVLFSATMPPSIMNLTKEFQNDPELVEINKKQVTLTNIEQSYIDVPMGRKIDALNLVLRFYAPALTMIFCNTKAMVDEISEQLRNGGFSAEGLHGDMKQSQRTKVLDDFKSGKTSILVATDVAARGIDVNDIEYVINYDVPQNTEYYVHRIGRTGRAGKSGCAITICSGRRQVFNLRDIGRFAKSDIKPMEIPSAAAVALKGIENNITKIQTVLTEEINPMYTDMLAKLVENGHSVEKIAEALLQLNFGKEQATLTDIAAGKKTELRSHADEGYQKIQISIGRNSRVAPNHIVGAITERTTLSGNEIGKIEIYDESTVVGIPSHHVDDVIFKMTGLKICGKPTQTTLFTSKVGSSSRPSYDNDRRRSSYSSSSSSPAKPKSEKYSDEKSFKYSGGEKRSKDKSFGEKKSGGKFFGRGN